MLTCEDCKEWEACLTDGNAIACDAFDYVTEEEPMTEDENTIHIRELTLAIALMSTRLSAMERRWNKMMAAIVREANE